MENLRDRAAKVLDMTHSYDGRGPKTGMARDRLALALDNGGRLLKKDVTWLETVIFKEGEKSR